MKNRHATPLTRAFASLAAALVASCGGSSYGGGDGDGLPPATLSISVDPATITLGESATITWSSNANNCNANGAWDGSRPGDGTETVTPTATGTLTYSMVCSGGRYSESEQGSATLTVEAARSAGLWVGDGCCVDTQSFAVAGLTNEAGGYRFLLLGTHYVGKSGEVPASYTTSDSGLAGRRATDPHAFRLLAIAPRASVRETIVATNRDGDAQIVRLSIPYDRSFERPARVGALEGHFTTHLGTGYTFTLSIESTGRLTGIDTNGCRLQGRASARHPSFNAFDVALDVSACGESDGRYAGDAALLFGGSDRATGLFLSASNPNSAIGWRLDR